RCSPHVVEARILTPFAPHHVRFPSGARSTFEDRCPEGRRRQIPHVRDDPNAMEASERPQLTFTETAANGTVRALDDRIVIESLTVDDERAAHLVRERQQAGKPAADTVRKAIEIGARVLDSEETAANVDYVRRELEAGLGELEKRLGGTLDEGAEALAEQLATTFG